MRLAAALPSLPDDAPQRVAIEELLRQLSEGGVEIEGFAERRRVAEERSLPRGGERREVGPAAERRAAGRRRAPFDVYHYLRLPERHRERPFDLALYPLGRDATPFEAALWLVHRFPGVVWLLDPVPHHLAIGGIGLRGKWGSYRGLLERTYGHVGASIAQVVGAGWGTGGLYRRYDLVEALAADQLAVAAAWPALLERLRPRLREEKTLLLPVPRPAAGARAEARAGDESRAQTARRSGDEPRTPAPWRSGDDFEGRAPSVAILSVNPANPGPAVRTAAAMLRIANEARIRVCVSGPVHHVASRVARRHGIDDRVEWILDPGWGELAHVAGEANIMVWANPDLLLGERLLLLDGVDAGKVVVVVRAPLFEDLPDTAVLPVDSGAAFAPTVARLFRELLADRELLGAVTGRARASSGNGAAASRGAEGAWPGHPDAGSPRATAAAVAAAVEEALEALARRHEPRLVDIAAPTWRAFGDSLRHEIVPMSADDRAQRETLEAIRAQIPK